MSYSFRDRLPSYLGGHLMIIAWTRSTLGSNDWAPGVKKHSIQTKLQNNSPQTNAEPSFRIEDSNSHDHRRISTITIDRTR